MSTVNVLMLGGPLDGQVCTVSTRRTYIRWEGVPAHSGSGELMTPRAYIYKIHELRGHGGTQYFVGTLGEDCAIKRLVEGYSPKESST
ncbi:MAG TPA: hypothetical protein VF800_02910 [Telluria sp.]|jgi:hypothetical protein